MTPGARVAAAIEVLDAISGGSAAEQALTRWARKSRFAGSGDRAAVRDHVFDALRLRATAACLGGGTSGRALMLGLLRRAGDTPETFFTGEGHAPAPLTPEEQQSGGAQDCADVWNLPPWLVTEFHDSLGPDARATDIALSSRAPVTLRVNRSKLSVAAAARALLDEGIGTEPNALSPDALTVTSGARKLRNSAAYRNGEVELQDAASQAVVAALPPGRRCLDYCAGGGGKALALAAQEGRVVFAHDIDPARMSDLPARADRAGAAITLLQTAALPDHAPFDLVLCDAPCSGSGSWRRAPEAKWSLTPDRLADLCRTQDAILARAAALVAPGGLLAYATCSVLKGENEDRIAAFLAAHPGWRCIFEKRFAVTAQGDGFYTAHLTHLQK